VREVSLKRLSYAAFVAVTTFIVTSTSPGEALAAGSVAPKHKTASLSQQIVRQANRVASSMSSVGFCYRGVKRALKGAGIALSGSSAFMAKRQLEQDHRFKKVPMKSLVTGDILVHGRSSAHPHGHIAVYLGNGREASDHIGKLVTGRRYGGTTIFRVKNTSQIANAERNTKSASPIIAVALQPSAAPAIAVAKPVPAKARFLDLTSALTKMLPVAQTAHLNLTAALANVAPEILSH